MSELYQGRAKLRKVTETFKAQNPKNYPEDFVLVENSLQAQFAGLLIQDSIEVCGVKCSMTQIEGIVICLRQSKVQGTKFISSSVSSFVAVEAKAAYLTLDDRIHWGRSETMIHQELCRQSKQLIQTKLHTLASNSNYAILDITGPGHMVSTAGAAVYIT